MTPGKRKSYDITKKILMVLDSGEEFSYGGLERSVNTNWQTIRDHCKALEAFDAIAFTKEGRVYITPQGKKALKRL